MGTSYFITGTDTDVGKTLVARTLLLALGARGIRCAGYKPVSAGCTRTPEGLRNRDALLLQQAATVALPYEQVNPYAFEPPIAPISPPVSGVSIPFEGCPPACGRLRELGPISSLSKGRGLVPAAGSSASALGVGRPGAAAGDPGGGGQAGLPQPCPAHRQRHSPAGLTLAGWVINRVDPHMSRYEENLDTLKAMLPAPFLGSSPSWTR
jgi:dethiobiotin synthetase